MGNRTDSTMFQLYHFQQLLLCLNSIMIIGTYRKQNFTVAKIRAQTLLENKGEKLLLCYCYNNNNNNFSPPTWKHPEINKTSVLLKSHDLLTSDGNDTGLVISATIFILLTFYLFLLTIRVKLAYKKEHQIYIHIKNN